MLHVQVLVTAAIYNYTLTLAAELQSVQQPGGPTDRHRAFERRLWLVRFCQCRGEGGLQALVTRQF